MGALSLPEPGSPYYRNLWFIPVHRLPSHATLPLRIEWEEHGWSHLGAATSSVCGLQTGLTREEPKAQNGYVCYLPEVTQGPRGRGGTEQNSSAHSA